MTWPSVSVVMTAYNYERTVGRALDSILAQEYGGEVDILVGDDCSTDGTGEIVREHQARYPDIVKPARYTENQGGTKNLRYLMERASGEFVAFCEGDDYWLSPHKLRIQLETLIKYPSASICFSQALAWKEGSSQWPQAQPAVCPEITTIHDLLEGNFIHSCTAVYRRIGSLTLPDWFETLKIGDWPMHLLQATNGPIVYVNQPLAVYRLHEGGNWSNRPFEERRDAAVEMLELIEPHLPAERRDRLRQTQAILRARIDDGDVVGLAA